MIRPRFAAALLVLVLAAPARADGTAIEVAAKVLPSIAAVMERGKACGTAYCVHSRGIYATCHHCTEPDSDKVELKLFNGRCVTAKILYRTEKTDVAILAAWCVVLADGSAGPVTPAIKIPDVDRHAVGQSVMAFGHPYGLTNSVTKGIISALDREIFYHLVPQKGMIQTDAAINPGNSGGPLVNMAGELVGMNSAGRLQSNGLGFAVPACQVREALLIALGKIDG